MARPSSLWTVLLYPLSLVGALALALAAAAQSWLAALTLASGLLFSLARMLGTWHARAVGQAREAAHATVWRGGQLVLGLGARRLGYSFAAALAGLGLLLFVAAAFRWNWVVLALALLPAGYLLMLMVQASQSNGPLLRITRQGIWDRHFGWVVWERVAAVEFSDYRWPRRRPRESALIVRLRPEAAQALSERRVGRGGPGLPVASLGYSREVISYTLDWLAVVPEEAFAAARGWWLVAQTGNRPSMEFEAATAHRQDERYRRVLRRLRRSTRLVLLSYGLAPFAFVADRFVGWPR
jgi:hypothetical protein